MKWIFNPDCPLEQKLVIPAYKTTQFWLRAKAQAIIDSHRLSWQATPEKTLVIRGNE
jgi:hypothetical protein